jgi:prevent-host-death family protein
MAHVTTLYDFRNDTGKYFKIAKTEPVVILKSKTGWPQLVLISAEEYDRLRGIK